MADEETKKSDIAAQITEFVAKNGVSTFLLIALAYVGWTELVKPASTKYVAMLDAVTESNVSLTATIAELKDGMVLIGQANTEIGNKNSESLKDIEDHLEKLEQISRDIDRKLDLLRRPSYSPEPEPVDEQ
tara:strand:+ start:496 stop:888 length:393 start_codon:yes stop_codon:yes gene_type:complete